MMYDIENIREFMKEKNISNNLDTNYPIKSLGIFQINKESPYNWNLKIKGPKESIYKDGVFSINIKFPIDYPENKPCIKFKTKIYHLQVSKEGGICAKFIVYWNKETSITELLVGIYMFFIEFQNPYSPFDNSMANIYRSNINEFNKIAKEWSLKYSKPSYEDLILISKMYDFDEENRNKNIKQLENKLNEIREKLSETEFIELTNSINSLKV